LAASRPSIAKTVVSLTVLALTLGFITWLVSLQGTGSIAVHFYYLPILWAGFALGDYSAIIVSLLAALACGPWMPAEPALGPETPAVGQGLWDIVLRLRIEAPRYRGANPLSGGPQHHLQSAHKAGAATDHRPCYAGDRR